MDRRTRARELAMQALCQLDVQGEAAFDVLERFFQENSEDKFVFELATKWCSETWKNIQNCDDMIKKAAVKWDIGRLAMVDRSILRLGTYQLKYCRDIPTKVTINEAIELAKKFAGESSSAFVNGILDAIRKMISEEANQVVN